MAAILVEENKLPYAVLVGTVGCGKSSLSSKLTSKKCGISHFCGSATRQSTIYRTSYFEFSDTPGYRSRKDKLDHAVNIICALQYKPVSRIFVLSKFDCRVDQIVNNAKEIITPFLGYRSLLTVVITAWDLSDRTQETKQKIIDAFHEDFDIMSLLFTEKDTKREELIKIMRNLLIEEPQKIEITAKNISKFFDLKKNDHEIIAAIRAKTETYQTMVQTTKNQANGMQQSQEKEDFVFLSQRALLEIKEQMKEEFVEQYVVDISDPEEFACLHQLHVQLHAAYKTYRDYCRQFIKDITAGVGNHPFRKCPHCGEVWTKVEGCDGSTTCGNLPTNSDHFVKVKWKWMILNGLINFKLEPAQPDVKKLTGVVKKLPVVSPAGCGKNIAWKDMQPITVPPEMLEVPLEMDPPAVGEDVEREVMRNVENALDNAILRLDSSYYLQSSDVSIDNINNESYTAPTTAMTLRHSNRAKIDVSEADNECLETAAIKRQRLMSQ